MVIYKKVDNICYINNIIFDDLTNSSDEKKKFNNIHNFLKYKVKNNEYYDYLIIDTNSVFLYRAMKKQFVDFDDITMKILANILNYYKIFNSPYRTKIVLSIDNGISNILKNLINYKGNRAHSIKKNLNNFSKNSNNLFNKMIANILDFMSLIGCYVDILKGEADFKIGLMIKKIIDHDKNSKILVISSDLDYIGLAEYADILIKRQENFIHIKRGDSKLGNMIDTSLNLYSPLQYYFYKALIGDPIDNIKRLISNKKAIKIINEYNKKYTTDEEVYNFRNFIKFCEDFVDVSLLSKNFYSCFPLNEDIFDDKYELEILNIFIDSIINKKVNHYPEILIEKLKVLNYGGKDFIEDFSKKLKELYKNYE